ncbi:hypothetical protein NQ318_007948 [Aromia moschata]|uniref:Uncharacterized protein n=1 Tax=Aromia moschata TaxID=1265417 RepID=A0AAV8YAA5_9CUCU|nr:hypothetical protein NQ318_007948 [Aromia moschata]
MSHYVTPFLVLNLGSEMIFVVAQRLQAQNIPHERATLGDLIIHDSRTLQHRAHTHFPRHLMAAGLNAYAAVHALFFGFGDAIRIGMFTSEYNISRKYDKVSDKYDTESFTFLSVLVLEEIISVLLSKQLIADLMKPQATYSHESVREIVEDVTQSSAMRLDAISMGKLWDLITMIFKWQTSMSDDVISITQRHLYEIENYVINQDTQQQLQRVQNIVENFNKVLDRKEKNALHDEVQYWLKDFNVKVSLLLRMGLQSLDGHFVVNNLDPIAEEMLRNLGRTNTLGENIYQKTGEKTSNRSLNRSPPVNELQLFANELLGRRQLNAESSEANANIFRLTISDDNANRAKGKKVAFDNIDVNIDDNSLQDLMGDMSLQDKEDANFRDDLLNMIGNSDEKSSA